MKINKNYRESRRRNKKYWEERARARSDVFVEDSEKIADELGKAYYSSSKIVEKEIAKVFQGFENAFGLSHAEAKRLIENAAPDVPSKEIIGIINGLTDNDLKQQLLGYISAPAYQYRINRLDEAVARAEKVCKSLYSSELHTDTEFFSSEIEKAYNHTIFDIQQGTGISGAFNQIPKSRIEEIMKNRWSGRHYSSRIWGNTSRLAETLKNNMLESFITGESEQKAAARVRERFGVAAHNARCLVRTENTYITNQAEISGYKEAQVDEYEYMAVMDDDTSPICRRLNGRSFPVSKARAGFNLPPMHPFCRSTTIGKIPSEEELDAAWDRDMTDMVPEDMDFEEWLDGLEPTEDGKLVFRDKRVDKSGKSGIINLYKGNGIDVVSSAEINDEVISRVEQATKAVTSDFRILEKCSEPISFDDVSDGYAQNDYNPKTGINLITLDKNAFSNPEKLLELLKDDYTCGKSYDTDYIESLVAHEMGHNAHIALALKRSGLAYGKPLSVIEQAIFNEEYTRISQEIYMAAFTDEDISTIYERCIKELGSMTDKSPNELIAQSFGNYYYGISKSEIAKRILRYFMKGLR
ncbi:MAG: minor capsid protein [Ruminiclostridium sp.]